MKEYKKCLHRKYRLSTEEKMKQCGINEMREEITSINLGDFLTLGKRNPRDIIIETEEDIGNT